jgi:anti-sigma regulatory factor (Ser/Thr protein kinase)
MIDAEDVERTTVPPTLASVPLTRRWLGERLAAAPPEVRETASLITSELVTNAVLHAATDITVTVRREPSGLRIEVADGDPQLPALKHYEGDAATGRGLTVVTALADTWGASRRGDGKVVWFELGEAPARVEEMAAQGTTAPNAGLRLLPMALLGIPVPAMTRAQAFYDELFREFRLLLELEADVPSDAIHRRLLALVDEVGTRFGGFTSGAEEAWRRALEEERSTVDLEFDLPADIGTVCARYDRLLDEADAFSRAGALMTLAASREALAVRKWVLDELVRQSEGEPAVPWDESVWARSLEAEEGSPSR